MTAARTPDHETPVDVVDVPAGTHGGATQGGWAPGAAPAAPPAPPRRAMRYRLSRTWQHDGWFNPRAWIEPTQFVLKDERGHVAYRMVALSAWSERRMSIQDADGHPLAALHKTWRYRSFRLLRGGRLAATINYKDPVWRWRDRYVVKAVDGTKIVFIPTSVGSGVYEFRQDGRTVGRYSRREGLEISDGIDPLLLIAAMLGLELPHEGSPG